ncbi:ChaN family lipoprotein [Sediminibacterium sp.]|uniref:ChaN family lipoprotein n=1 Tax=Sediminibacterium sp. TaxID=1917865 RepID=UPI0025FC76CD|nr:ChaN family lipoprotein [Sediminibacterium sp.]MBW0176764.1 ChaN family lipoprotein [Sediminibacterium sp.]
MKKIIFALLVILSFTAAAQKKQPYVLYNAKGKKVGYEKMLKTIADKDILLFGEFHNNAIAHWLQLEVTKDLKEKRNLVLGAEMFEQDNQEALDLYLAGTIKQKQLDSMARLWKNYPTDYAPLVNFAKENKIPFAASNVPRRYASMVSRGGFTVLDTLTAKEKAWMAPLPIAYDAALPGYKKMVEMMGGHGGENLPKAQALKDATMAHFMLRYYQPGSLLIHYNGAYHSDFYDGLNWYLKKQNPALKIVTISTVSQKDIHKLSGEHLGRADFIICVDEDMTNTY